MQLYYMQYTYMQLYYIIKICAITSLVVLSRFSTSSLEIVVHFQYTTLLTTGHEVLMG